MLLQRRHRTPLDAWRRRMIRETESALLYALNHPASAPRIPTVEVGRGSFEPAYASRWWVEVLDLDADR